MPGFDPGIITVRHDEPKKRAKVIEPRHPLSSNPEPVVTETDSLAETLYALIDAFENGHKVTIKVRAV